MIRKYTVNQSVWLSAALYAYIKFKSGNIRSEEDLNLDDEIEFEEQDVSIEQVKDFVDNELPHILEAFKNNIALTKKQEKDKVTKWKRLIDNERANYGISQADMYQMYAYSKKYETPEIWLLYPVNEEMRNHSDIRFDSGDGTTVRVHFVDVAHIEDSLEELKTKLA